MNQFLPQILRYIWSTKSATSTAVITISHCSGVSLVRFHRAKLPRLSPPNTFRVAGTIFALNFPYKLLSRRKWLTVSRDPQSHSSFPLACSLDLDKFKLHAPSRSFTRIVCSCLVPKNNDGVGKSMRSLNMHMWSRPNFWATLLCLAYIRLWSRGCDRWLSVHWVCWLHPVSCVKQPIFTAPLPDTQACAGTQRIEKKIRDFNCSS